MKKFKKISTEKFELKTKLIAADKVNNITGGSVGPIGTTFPCGS